MPFDQGLRLLFSEENVSCPRLSSGKQRILVMEARQSFTRACSTTVFFVSCVVSLYFLIPPTFVFCAFVTVRVESINKKCQKCQNVKLVKGKL